LQTACSGRLARCWQACASPWRAEAAHDAASAAVSGLHFRLAHQKNAGSVRDSRTTSKAQSRRGVANVSICKKFVSVQIVLLLRTPQSPGMCAEIRARVRQKPNMSQRLSAWRRERDSNYESGSPYPFEKSGRFRVLGTREGSCRCPQRCGQPLKIAAVVLQQRMTAWCLRDSTMWLLE
jgi:hypothetical protein